LVARTYLRADDRRAQILEVAKRIFATRGFHSANIADICAAARIARGTLYQYFENKRAVFLAVLEDIAERVEGILRDRTPVAEIPGVSEAPLAMVVAFAKDRLRELLDVVFEDEETLRLLLREAWSDERWKRCAAHRWVGFGHCEKDIRAAQEVVFSAPMSTR
jgi:AcrR family transcriptional regulator